MIIGTILVIFCVTSLFGYLVHRALHQPWLGRFHKSHMIHHMTLYPPTDYTSDKYRSAGKDNTVWFFVTAAIPLIIIPIILSVIGVLPLLDMIISLFIMAIMGVVNNYLHDAFHIKNHFLNRIPLLRLLFNFWNKLHYLHHVDMDSNFGIFLFFWDKVFFTFRVNYD